MNELFEAIDPEEDALENTPEEEAFRLADKIYPIGANTFRKQPVIQADMILFKVGKIYELARFINPDLGNEDILESALRFGDDTIAEPFESDNIVKIYFKTEGITKFLKWCEPREKDLFNQ